MSEVKLTRLSHGGGCGCKIAPALLHEILGEVQQKLPFPDLLVGTETSDDAAVYRLNDQQAIIATTDFFMPIVDDPFDFGRIAATNAMSDVYAMGGTPIMALAIVGMPIDKLPVETIRDILQGGEAVCRDGRHPARGRTFHRCARADLRPGRTGRGASGSREEEQRGTGRRCADPRQRPGGRRAGGGAEERAAVRCRLRATDCNHHAAQHRGQHTRRTARCACTDRRDRLRFARASAGDVSRFGFGAQR